MMLFFLTLEAKSLDVSLRKFQKYSVHVFEMSLSDDSEYKES